MTITRHLWILLFITCIREAIVDYHLAVNLQHEIVIFDEIFILANLLFLFAVCGVLLVDISSIKVVK